MKKRPAACRSRSARGGEVALKRPASVAKRPSQRGSTSQPVTPEVLKGLKAYVVNLDRRPDRWKQFSSMASRELPWLQCERFSASDGNKEPIPEDEVATTWSTKHNSLYGDYSEWNFDAPGTDLHGTRWKWACDADAEDEAWKFTEHDDDTGVVQKVSTGEEWRVIKSDQRYKDGVDLFLSKGERGCASSHRRLWAVAAQRSMPTLVFEDDVKLCSPKLRPRGKSNGKRFSSRLALALECAPADFDVLYLGWAGHRAGNLKHLKEQDLKLSPPVHDVLRRVEYVWTTVAYVISAAGAQKLLAAATPMNQPVDNFMAWEAREGRLKSFVVLEDGDEDELWNGGIVDQVDFQGDSNIKKSDGGDQGDDMELFVVGKVQEASV
eukprot:TRINITY_DN5001_c0_g1_i1.p1 TRINITY_DN5001_c0_g1~~TRINITY_DN5001_c0_g1_i1.p1  ORF type:complete len:380 (-),score=84.12 TRINITY_DN5001_c0_g1_i1:24-1163(-)